MKKFLTFFVALLLCGPAMGEDVVEPVEPTRIEADSKKSQIRFFIDDELSAVLTREGLIILNGIEYGSAITDTGKEGFYNKFPAAVESEAKHAP